MLVNILQSVKEWARDWSESTFLKLSGGTLTGALNGTSATFSGDVSGDSATFSGDISGNNADFGGDINVDGNIQATGNVGLTGQIYWKENGYGDKFAITTYFNGVDDANLLKIQSAVGGAGTDPTLSDKVTISGKSGDVTISGRIKKTGSAISYITGNQGEAALYLSKATGSVWYPAITLDTTSGGSWSIGNYNNENLQFSWASKANRDSSTNSTTIVNLPNNPGTIPVPVQLYYNATGTDGTVTLSQTAANFNYLRIYFKKNGDTNACASTDLYSPNGKKATLIVSNVSSSIAQLTWKIVTISGTSITVSSQIYWNRDMSSSSMSGGTTDAKVYIYRVEGWK